MRKDAEKDPATEPDALRAKSLIGQVLFFIYVLKCRQASDGYSCAVSICG